MTTYITSQGAANLKKELEFLWSEERPKIVDNVHEAAKNGDRSENGDYIYGKRKLREIDRRIRYITKQLATIQVVRKKPTDRNRIYFSAFVKLRNMENEKIMTFRLVGIDETNPEKRWINFESPLSKSLLGKSASDIIELTTANTVTHYEILEVWY
ncbi:MAG: GreA/GreB family elongation factor [Pseudomonadota bacterium]|jgi:transcription elongation factor GreB|nr:transcription elongation factor GreB [Porticoccaceae bacterium]MEC7389580.1 GreA/GreB family elongation factor [Pseudomonadota bacterium]MED6344640.1 GreA/GreB family elongation factor [Pseudomonadota bacterium]|tara:strand:+ start:130 stop:597 length:468 start_codon:yes stop_codon:yes gene_type:complete